MGSRRKNAGIRLTKGDGILMGVLLLTAVLISGGIFLYQKQTTGDNSIVRVYRENLLLYEGPLSFSCEKVFAGENGNYNVLVVRDGYADMTEASCPDKICVNHRKISRNGQTIVCLPNRLIVKIENEQETGVDGISE